MFNRPVSDIVNGLFPQPQDQQPMLDIAAMYKRLFSTEDGRKVLAIMVSSTIMQPTVTGQSTQFEAGIREGRADIVRGILRQIELAETNGKETLHPWQTLTPPPQEPAPRKKSRRTSSTRPPQ